MTDTDKRFPWFELLAATGIVTGLLLAWLYAVGWSYAYHYFDRFRIPLLMVEIPRDHMFAYGGLALLELLPLSAVAAVCLFLVGALFHYAYRPLGFPTLAGLALVAIAGLFLSANPIGIAAAGKAFSHQQRTDFAAYPRVTIIPAADAGTTGATPAALRNAASGCAKLLLFNDDRVFLIVPIHGAPHFPLSTYVLPWSAINAMTLTADYTACD